MEHSGSQSLIASVSATSAEAQRWLKITGTTKDQVERPASFGMAGNGAARRTARSAAWSIAGLPEGLAIRTPDTPPLAAMVRAIETVPDAPTP